MLITTLRLYERVLLGLSSPDEEVREAAKGCMSYLVWVLPQRQVNLPPPVVSMLQHLPEGRIQ